VSGYDILYWLEGIWYDVTHLATADIPSLMFRLFVLLVAIVVGQHLIRVVLRILWDIVRPVAQLIRDILWGIWWVVSAPVRVPMNWLRNARQRKESRTRQRELQAQAAFYEQQRQDEIAAKDRQQREEYQRMKGMMNKLE